MLNTLSILEFRRVATVASWRGCLQVREGDASEWSGVGVMFFPTRALFLGVVPMRRKAYRSTEVKHVELELVVARGPQGALTVGLDVGKFVIYVVVRWSDGSFERPWTVENPSEIELLVRLLVALAASRKMTVAMESTGTYGDALRGKLSAAGLLLHRVGGKAASDYAEIFDGVPSQHDGKDAAVVAELAAIGKSRAWPLAQPSDADGAMKIELLVGSAAGTVGCAKVRGTKSGCDNTRGWRWRPSASASRRARNWRSLLWRMR
jgi:hypothetical protein